MPKEDQNDSTKLCPAGEILKAEINAGIFRMEELVVRQERSSSKIADSVERLVKYSIRDKKDLETLEKQLLSLEAARPCLHKVKNDLAYHLGEHEEATRVRTEELEEFKKAGTRKVLKIAPISGLGGAALLMGALDILETVKAWIASH